MKTLILLSVALAASGRAGEWTQPVEVRSQETLCLAYQARLDGPFLVIRAKIEPGWHTFAMDNKQRAEEKLAGKRALSVDRATEIDVGGSLESLAPWYQTPPRDFSRPQLRWFSWGFEREATFATKVRQSGAGPAQITIRGQACTETVCKNIDATVSFTVNKAETAAGQTEVDLKSLTPVISAH